MGGEEVYCTQLTSLLAAVGDTHRSDWIRPPENFVSGFVFRLELILHLEYI